MASFGNYLGRRCEGPPFIDALMKPALEALDLNVLGAELRIVYFEARWCPNQHPSEDPMRNVAEY